MTSDARRLGEAYRHIRRIKAEDYPVIVGNSAGANGGYRIVERPWRELPEPSKLAILQDAVDWSGISNRDQAHILLAEIDPGMITDAQRNRLIDMAAVKTSYAEVLREAAALGEGMPGRSEDRGKDEAGIER
jgi:hypothetical protein